MPTFHRISIRLLFSFLIGAFLFNSFATGQQQTPENETSRSESQISSTTEQESEKSVSIEERIDQLQQETSSAALAGNNSWMLISCALVLFMTAPGLAMFYGGLVRKKNIVSVLIQCLFLMCLMSLIWATYGYSLAFSDGGSINDLIGGIDYVFLNDVQRSWDEEANVAVTPMADAIPRLTHMLFQGMFFIITPALICGAFAERMKFSAMVVFSVLWGTIVYCPLAHWVWGGGILAYPDGMVMGGALDFAGGTVVHISSGVAALLAAIIITPRIGHNSEPMPPHNLTYTALGAAMLWFGWFGFNAGSELASDELTSSAFAATHFAAAAGGFGWTLIEWLSRGKPTVLGVSSGLVAGLVCVTPAAGFVHPMPAILLGFIAGIVCYFACTILKKRFGYDDALDAFGIHGVGGILGAILTGVFATRAAWDVTEDGRPLGLLEGGGVLIPQIVAVIITIAFTVVGTWVILKIIDWTIGLRVTAEEERQGLDIALHGEEGYIFL